MNNLLTVKNVSITYEGKEVIGGVSFNVAQGDFLVIFGENGSGKSSLVKVLLGLKAPSKGEIAFAEDFNRWEIGYLPQTTAHQNDFPASAWEVVISGCLNQMGHRPFYGKKEKEAAKKNMELLSIYNLKNECFRNLSGGQKQRVLLARALCATGKLLLLDEPVAGLDNAAAADFYEAICKINSSGVAVVMVSHDIHTSLSVAKHVLKLGNGNELFYGTPIDYEREEFFEK